MKMRFVMSLLVAGAVPVFFSSCDKDEKPKNTGISFALDGQEVSESDGTIISFHPEINTQGGKGRDITVNLELDRPVNETVVLQYALSGTATNVKTSQTLNDYVLKDGLNTVVGTNKITIEKGASEATVVITLFEDFEPEINEDGSYTETIIITLESVDSGTGVLGDKTTFTLTVVEDDAIILLQWLDSDIEGETHGDVDMDMFLWAEEDPENPFLWSATVNPDGDDIPFELLTIPGGLWDGDYKMSYTYYSGTSDNVDFFVTMWGNINSTFYPYFEFEAGDFVGFTGNYKLVNINEFDSETGTAPAKVQTVNKSGITFSPSQITIPESGSRSSGKITLPKYGPSLLRNLRFAPAQDNSLIFKKLNKR